MTSCPITSRLRGGKQRARSEADKLAREQQILDAAAGLFARRRYSDLTLADVAAASGLTKAALYRYFRNKEVLFIAVYQRAFTELVADAKARAPLRLPDDLAGRLVAHPLFCSLSAILHVALETGLNDHEAKAFKGFLLAQSAELATLIQAASGKPPEACFAFLMRCQQALIGCWHMSHPPEVARRAMAHPPLDAFRMDFEPTLRAHLQALYDAFTTSSP
ncbi:TetR family transcriptional regulator [Marinobacter sp. C2H3]|uniref:TetR family transcriptional regulator n=1 Tax=Marinobacter sp. C2H3 TaxID=3119003 RepID=UPI00300EF076